ncbi:MAG: thioredoxin, partial [Candidatus Dormibacteraceae bacterium]
ESNFEQVVIKSPNPVLVDFWATWCGPCKMLSPIVEQLATEYGGRLPVHSVDTDQNQGLVERYQIRGVPTLAIFNGGELIDRLVGYPGPAKVREFFEKHALVKA